MKLRFESDEPLPNGLYAAHVVEVTEDVGQFGPQLKVLFEVDGGEHDGRQLVGWCSAKLSSRSKLAAWVKAILRLEALPAGYELDTESLAGKPVTIATEKVQRTDGDWGNKIAALYPAGQGAPAATAMQQEGMPF